MKTSTLAVASVATCFASLANADTVTYNASYSGAGADNTLIAVSQFDSGLGTLESASFVLGANATSTLSFSNYGKPTVTWDRAGLLTLTGDAGYSNLFASVSTPNSTVATFASGTNTLAGPGSYVWSYTAPTLSASATLSQGASAAFIGTGNLNFYLTDSTMNTTKISGQSWGGVPSAWQSMSTPVNGNVSVTYTYTAVTAVPEPETYAMLLSGLGLVGFIACRRKRSVPPV